MPEVTRLGKGVWDHDYDPSPLNIGANLPLGPRSACSLNPWQYFQTQGFQMKFFLFALFAGFIALLPQKSDAFIYGEDYRVDYVSETPWLDQANRPLSLCVLKEYWHIMWIPVWSSYEYVLADNNCDTDSIYSYQDGELAAEIKNGDITSIDNPEVPMTFGRILWGYTLLLAIIPVVLFGIYAVRAQNKRSARRAELTAHIPEKVRGPLAFLLQAALSDGAADDNELNAISRALKDVYSQRLTVPQLRELIDNTDMNADAPEIGTFLLQATGEEKHQALRLLVMVTAADGRLDDAEMKFAVEMGAKLGFTQADVSQVYQAMSTPAEPEV